MNILSTAIKSAAGQIARLRHSRGFGVHSPMAFEALHRVIRPKGVAYYGYHDIDLSFDNSSVGRLSGRAETRLRNRARLLLRLTVWQTPPAVWIWPGAQRPLHAAIRAAGKGIRISSRRQDIKKSRLIVTDGGSDMISDRHLAELMADDHRILLLFSPEAGMGEKLLGTLPHGLMLESRDWLMVFNRPDMQPIGYSFP